MPAPLDNDVVCTDFIRKNTELLTAPLVPEISLHLATDKVPMWRMTEEELLESGIAPPFWAFAWAGGQALARYVLDEPEAVRGKRVLDFASGCGIAAIAAMKAGAASALAADIDPLAEAAAQLNAAENSVLVATTTKNLVGKEMDAFDVILAGDICYEQPLAEEVRVWLEKQSMAGATVLLGDPGRTYLPRPNIEEIRAYAVMTSRELEDTDVRNARVWHFETRALRPDA